MISPGRENPGMSCEVVFMVGRFNLFSDVPKVKKSQTFDLVNKVSRMTKNWH